VVVPEKGTIHGTRPQYFSNGFSRSNYRDEHRRLGRIQEICVTRKRRECPLLTQSEHQRPSISSRLSAWCPKGQFISRRVDVKIGGLGQHGG
jgi:hypothetical protein